MRWVRTKNHICIDLYEVGKNKKPHMHMNIFTGRSHTSIVRRTKQNAATLGLSLVNLGLHWGPLWRWACNMPILDLEEVGRKQKNNLYRGVTYQHCTADKAKRSYIRGISGWFGAAVGAPMAISVQYAHPRLS